MSHPQSRGLRVLKLTRAWLNLWDKHMTTGRINQISMGWGGNGVLSFWGLSTEFLDESGWGGLNQLNDVCDEDEGVRKLRQRRRKHFTLSLPFFSLDASFFVSSSHKSEARNRKNQRTNSPGWRNARPALSMRRKQTLTQPLAGGADWKPCRSGTTSRTDLTSSIDALSGEKERLSQMNHGQRDREGTPNT